MSRLDLPTPLRSRPGEDAPWAHLPGHVRRGITMERVSAAVADPGAEVRFGPGQLAMRDALFDVVDDSRQAAVLVPMFEEGGEVRVVLTVRSRELRAHSGEVAFPGGRVNDGETLEDAALREAREEVGLERSSVTVIGDLTPMPTVASNMTMTPYLGRLAGRPELRANPAEVARIFDVALADLVAPGVYSEEYWSVRGRPGLGGEPGAEFPVWFFEVAGELVWGATARVLVELLCRIFGLPGPFATW